MLVGFYELFALLVKLLFTAFVAFFAVYFFVTDIHRVLLYTAYRFGYKQGSGKGPIPGPVEDTRISRFTKGEQIVSVYRREYGPLYRVFCGAIPEIVLTDPDDIRAYYHKDARVHYKIPNIGFGEYMGRVLGQSVGVKHNEDWLRLRSFIDPHFTAIQSFDFIPVMITDTEAWLAQLPNLPTVKGDERENRLVIKCEELVSELPFKMIARVLFGDLLDDHLLNKLYGLNAVHERLISRTFLGKFEQWKMFRYLPVQANRDVDNFEADWAALLTSTSLEAEQRGIHTAVGELYKNMKAGRMSFLEFAHTLDEILFTNIDVTTTSVAWVTAQVAMASDVQARLYQEIKVALSDDTMGCDRNERAVAYIMRTDTLLHYCYLESGRLHPVLFYSLPEMTADAKIIHGYHVPPKTSVLIDAWTLNRKSAVWGDDGDSFRPDRFRGLSPTQYRYAYWRFGLGPRKCVGINIGDKIIKTILVGIMEKYKVEVADDMLCENQRMFVHAPSGVMYFSARP